MQPAPGAGGVGGGASLAGTVLDDRFRITDPLGAGGMASVWLAEGTRLNRRVVVKMPHAALLLDEGFRTRFRREVTTLSSIEHPHVVKVIDTGESGGRPYAVLQHLPGGSLRERLDAAGRPMTAMEVVPWLAQAASALDHVHRRGLLHRDVKPANLIYDEADYVVLADFGIAKDVNAAATQLTETGTTPGSPGYMAPEAVRVAQLTPAYDQFALAVTAYECLTGRLPHRGETPLELLTSVLHDEPDDLAALVPTLPAQSAHAVMRALSRDPAARWPDCRSFAEAFGAGLGVTLSDPKYRALATGFHRPGDVAPMRRGETRRIAVAAAAVAVLAAGLGAGWALRGGGAADGATSPPAEAPKPPVEKRDLGEPPWKLVTPPEGPAWAKVSEKQIEEAKRLGVPVAFENSLGMRFVLIPAGKFTMGSPDTEVHRQPDEALREVPIDRAFYMSIWELTNGQARKFDPEHRSSHATAGKLFDDPELDADDRPAINMSFVGAVSFCAWLSRQDAGGTYRPASSAEWEYAARAGAPGRWFWGDDISETPRFANVPDRRARDAGLSTSFREVDDGWARTSPVGSFLPNAFGLYDVLGNAGDVCSPETTQPPYGGNPPADKSDLRGGAFVGDPSYVRLAAAMHGNSTFSWTDASVRVICEVPRRDLGETPWKLVTPPEGPAWAKVSEKQIEEAKRLGVPVAFENSLGMRFVLIPAGTSVFGAAPDDVERQTDELPRRDVEIREPYYLAVHELTNGTVRRVRPEFGPWSPNVEGGDEHPAVFGSPESLRVVLADLLAQLGADYRIPTETEWEHACRAGTSTSRYWGDGIGGATRFANFADAASRRRFPKWSVVETEDDGFGALAPAGSLLPNPWGLHDTLGNVLEACAIRAEDGAAGPLASRGGGADGIAANLRAAARATTADWSSPIGVRLLAGLSAAKR
ncbi:MAG: Serine/threonine-protein kinase PknD [Planctomycetes bacterium]|nr:Serine/threonine-protein kinase PknD [Planctomycetota bacterium]